jgi:hypothetical protein
MAHEMFGESRPDVPEPRRDERGNCFRPPMVLQPLKIEKGCQCKEHTMLQYSIEMNVMTCSAFEALLMLQRGEQPSMAAQWVPVTRVQMEHN